ncbi:MAG: hypothetical protein KBA86_04260 [Bacteroidales bacterium]|nr:hypothetical protein [Bacteroidales bacterium]
MKENSGTRLSKRKKIALILINFVFSIILASFTVQFFPPIYFLNIQIDLFLFIIIYFCLCQFVLIRFAKRFLALYYLGSFLLLLILSWSGLSWNIKTIYHNTQVNFTQLFSSIAYQVEILPAANAVAPHISLQQRIQQRVDYKDSVVRDFAVKNSLLYFDEYYFKFGQICRHLSLFKYIRENFKYVRDPNGFDYFASPQESIQLMGGDCDDYSIKVASTFKAIGADIRIIWAPGHVYPELYCGNQKNFDKYAGAIYSFFEKEIGDKKIYYRLDKNGDFWINLDYTDNYPGAYYYSEEVLSIIYIK